MTLLFIGNAVVFAAVAIVAFIVLIGVVTALFYRKVPQGQALVRTGQGGTRIAFDKGMQVWPVLHIAEVMDTSVKKMEISRLGKDGLICKDNLRADIKVVFFVRVNKSTEDVKKVASTIGCARASSLDTLVSLFDAKFSEALKTVGKKFEFEELYDSRERFKEEILEAIGRDLNGYVLDDCAIDYLEQTPIQFLKEDNILDSQGIKKITELTANEKIKANLIRREEEKTITKQDVEAREAILELERQLAEKEEVQKREIETIKAREEAETKKVQEEERLKSEQARIATEEELQIAEENKQRQVIIAQKQKERVEAVETERVEKDKMLEVTEREKIVSLAQIEKEKAIEEEKRNIQDVIKERVIVEKAVVEEEEKIKDTQAFAEADRNKQVAITLAEQEAEQDLVKTIKQAEADREAAKVNAEKKVIDAEAAKNAASKEADAKKILAEAKAAEEAAMGKSEAQVIEAKAQALEREGLAEAVVIEKKGVAEAKAIEAKADAEKKRGMVDAEVLELQGTAEAKVIEEKAMAEAKMIQEKAMADAKGIEMKGIAEAKGIHEKAEAMKQLDGVGKEHEEFKLKLEKEKAIELAAIQIQQAIAEAQAMVISEGLKSANIDIVGGETMFFENIINAVTRGKAIDRTINSSQNVQALKAAFLNGNGNGNPLEQLKHLMNQFGLNAEDVKNLSLTALIIKMIGMTSDGGLQGELGSLLTTFAGSGIASANAAEVLE